ncbi:MAG: hypothetical protein H0T91_01200, partial [Propionibacteriaceae bacterium]|nr:hypothetical protein [Propionibacteriaceae bacterium]
SARMGVTAVQPAGAAVDPGVDGLVWFGDDEPVWPGDDEPVGSGVTIPDSTELDGLCGVAGPGEAVPGDPVESGLTEAVASRLSDGRGLGPPVPSVPQPERTPAAPASTATAVTVPLVKPARRVLPMA